MELTLEDWIPHVGSTFAFHHQADRESTEVTLTSATSLGMERPSGHSAYSVVFSGPKSPSWEQGLIRVSHTSIGMLDVFMVPIGENEEARRYEAVFN